MSHVNSGPPSVMVCPFRTSQMTAKERMSAPPAPAMAYPAPFSQSKVRFGSRPISTNARKGKTGMSHAYSINLPPQDVDLVNINRLVPSVNRKDNRQANRHFGRGYRDGEQREHLTRGVCDAGH